MKVFACNKLSHTLQTHLGMVMNGGKPQYRSPPSFPSHLTNIDVDAEGPRELSDEALAALFANCVCQGQWPEFRSRDWLVGDKPHFLWKDDRHLLFNIGACRNSRADIEFMRKNLVNCTRLDLEQAAAVVISAIWNDATITARDHIVSSLVAGLDQDLLIRSCMWLEKWQTDPGVLVKEAKFYRLVDIFYLMCIVRCVRNNRWSIEDFDDVNDWTSLLPFLLRVRRCEPRSRCLFIPRWIFESAGMLPPPEFEVWDEQGRAMPGHEPNVEPKDDADHIILTRKAFRALQRRILRYYRFWDPTIRLRKAIDHLEADITYSNDFIRSKVLGCEDTLTVARHFFAIQRRLQRKVVSDLQWTAFLEKGESGNVLQNNPDIPTAFEQCLGELSGQHEMPVSGQILPQIDQCCLLMEEYVSIYGEGDRNKLVFVPGVRGGSGRGSVDEYNALCDILKNLCKAARDKGLPYPDPVRKFLAKDIMAWNKSFGDDAFANGQVPGWETWLAARREHHLLRKVESLKISEDNAMMDG